MKRIAVLFPSFLGGGAESVCLWMLQALRDKYDLTLITFSEIDFDKLNAYYGTSLSSTSISVYNPFSRSIMPVRLRQIFTQSYSMFTLRQHLLSRYFKHCGVDYDLAISAFQEMDFGYPGIQYVNFPMFGQGIEKSRLLVNYPDSNIRQLYRYFCQRLSGYSQGMMLQNTTVANSIWTARAIFHAYGVRAPVIYPPVLSDYPYIPWDEKEFGFVCIGRMVEEKRLDAAIRILKEVRENGHDVHLHIISGGGDLRYKKYIYQFRDRYAGWVFIEESLSRQRMIQLVAKHKFGLHTRKNEQFGIAVAEMLKAGCIPFVPSEGGQVEIVGDNPDLWFENEPDAVRKITKVLSSAGKQDELIAILQQRTELFDERRFTREFRQLVKDHLGSCK